MLGATGAGGVGAIESLEEMRQMVRRDAGTIVGDGERDVIIFVAARDDDAILRVFDGVGEEVGDDLPESLRVAEAGRGVEVQFERDGARFGESLHKVEAVVGGIGEIAGIAPKVQAAPATPIRRR